MLRKKIAAGFMAALMIVQPMTAAAADLGGAFQSLLGPTATLSANAPSRFNSSARTGFSAGGLELRVPRTTTTPTLFTASLPSVSAGCNGISAHFGGFSFISGEEFVKLLKQIASGAALGFVSSLVMKTLCPPCEAIVQELKAAAQLAAQLAKNSCAIGQKAGADFLNGLTGNAEASGSTAGAGILASSNQASDFSAGYSSLMSGLDSVATTIRSYTDSVRNATGGQGSGSGTGSTSRLADMCVAKSGLMGNQTWRRLTALNGPAQGGVSAEDAYKQKLVLMNITGAYLTYAGDSNPVSCVTGNGSRIQPEDSGDPKFCAPTMDTTKLVAYFMCGDPAALASNPKATERIKKYCATDLPTDSAANMVWVCDDKENCNNLKMASAGELFTGNGFMLEVSALLQEAVRRVTANEALVQGPSDQKGQDIIRLINTAPFPLYQAINAAAVYPSAALDLLDTMSTLIAEQFSYAYLEESLRITGRESSELCVSEKEIISLMEFLSNIRTIAYERKQQTATHFTVQQQLHEQIRSLNIGIQRQVLSAQMLSNNRAAAGLNEDITRSVTRSAPPSNP